jgi:hypothetical protein
MPLRKQPKWNGVLLNYVLDWFVQSQAFLRDIGHDAFANRLAAATRPEIWIHAYTVMKVGYNDLPGDMMETVPGIRFLIMGKRSSLPDTVWNTDQMRNAIIDLASLTRKVHDSLAFTALVMPWYFFHPELRPRSSSLVSVSPLGSHHAPHESSISTSVSPPGNFNSVPHASPISMFGISPPILNHKGFVVGQEQYHLSADSTRVPVIQPTCRETSNGVLQYSPFPANQSILGTRRSFVQNGVSHDSPLPVHQAGYKGYSPYRLMLDIPSTPANTDTHQGAHWPKFQVTLSAEEGMKNASTQDVYNTGQDFEGERAGNEDSMAGNGDSGAVGDTPVGLDYS